ncbi:helix-turn-helix domain-containing protein [Streptomyces niveiscabiei]|uniref:helix-turn-helix domain-containing protein n=1 Tax=Streptomyces niveiscabiei TaxID=164115 RepID=UPI00389AB095
MEQDAELGDFLRGRRARLNPADAGPSPGPGVRRAPGLRREEVARLAGVSADYYARLEQGRHPRVSDAVLDSVARALRLSHDERGHLFDLVRHRTARSRPRRPVRSVATRSAQGPHPGIRAHDRRHECGHRPQVTAGRRACDRAGPEDVTPCLQRPRSVESASKRTELSAND